ncbi:peptidase S49-like protein [Nitrosospira sp. Nsp2]|uniref:S49 family peptidase n=1 Tax=Nitrosospira sp. Nsp2 TaxID=136548 RepID=UPI000D2F95B2|nr:S49 family peptidase [Nitrosospira sp. Nsp2]PTR15056.1 peptidase S49-like protein [Nitrosospira sp. Nsp2]
MNPQTELSGRPWALHRETFESLIRNVSAAGPGLKSPPGATRRRTEGGVAVIGITGVITPRASLFNMLFGGTDVETIKDELGYALADSSVSKIVLNVDSPGGAVPGISELADLIYRARSIKSIDAHVSGMGASAAYWLASAASSITISDTASVGSIGVVGTIIDDRVRQGMEGITFHEIVSSNAPRKRPDPLTQEGRAVLQSGVDSLAAVFTAKVATYRGVSEKKVNSDFGQGGMLVGAEAVRAGLADRIGTFESVLGAPGAAPGAGQGAAAVSKVPAGLSVEDSCVMQWRNDPAIRAEFPTLESFTAYTRATGAGRCSIIAGRVTRGR